MIFDMPQRFALGILTNGIYASAFIGLTVFILGMIIVHFTPEDDRDRKRKPSKQQPLLIYAFDDGNVVL